MGMKITHGMYRNPVGSARIVSGEDVVLSVIQPLYETVVRGPKDVETVVEVRYRSHVSGKTEEDFIAYIIKKVVKSYLIPDLDSYRTLTIDIVANTMNLAMIGNSVLIAILDAGIPLLRMFYCVGEQNLYVSDALGVTPYYISEPESAELGGEIEYVRESVEYAIRDMFSLKLN